MFPGRVSVLPYCTNPDPKQLYHIVSTWFYHEDLQAQATVFSMLLCRRRSTCQAAFHPKHLWYICA